MNMRRFRPPTWYRSELKPRARQLRRGATPAKRKLWYEFLSSHREKFTRQKPIGLYIADFYCARKRLAIELDGDSHFTDHGRRHDETRTAALALDDIQIIRFTNADVMMHFEAVCASIEQALKT